MKLLPRIFTISEYIETPARDCFTNKPGVLYLSADSEHSFVAVVEYRLWCLLDRYSSASNFIPNLVTVKKKHWEHLCVCTSEPLLLNGNRNKNNNNLQTNEILRIGQFFESYMKLVLFGYGSIVFICFRCIQLIFTWIFEDKKTIYIICCTTTLSIRIRVSFFMFYCIDTTSGKHDT